MNNVVLKELFKKSFPVSLSPLLEDLLDENIESVLNGSTKVNDIAPQTDEEYLTALMIGFYARFQVLEALKLSVPSDNSMSLNYRGHQYEFPARL